MVDLLPGKDGPFSFLLFPDVDECQTGIHRCGEGQICQNVPGSYRCNCQTGYQFDAIRQSCVGECAGAKGSWGGS